MGKLVVLDIDEVLACFNERALQVNNAYFGNELTMEEFRESWKDTRWSEGRTMEEFHELATTGWTKHVKNIKLYNSLRVVADAYKALSILEFHGAEFALLTSRRVDIADETEEWLSKNFPGIVFEELLFSGAYDGRKFDGKEHLVTKGEIVKDLDPVIFVDDQPKHVLSAVEKGVPGLLFGEAWEAKDINEDVSRGLYRAKNWVEAVPKILKLLT